MPQIIVRAYQPEDSYPLADSANRLFPARKTQPRAIRVEMFHWQHHGGLARVVEVDGVVVGFTAVSPLPGLPGLYELDGYIDPHYQRQGIGSYLLQQFLSELRVALPQAQKISAALSDMGSSTAFFLQKHNFVLDHEEWLLTRPAANLPPAPLRAAHDMLRTFNREDDAIRAFIQLYDLSFGPHPWYQPYSYQDVGAAPYFTLDNLLFVQRDNQPVGVAWLYQPGRGSRVRQERVGQIEPIAIHPAFQGQGYGRFLLLSALHRLVQRGAQTLQIGCWQANETAVRLYQSVGFAPKATTTYLVYALAG